MSQVTASARSSTSSAYSGSLSHSTPLSNNGAPTGDLLDDLPEHAVDAHSDADSGDEDDLSVPSVDIGIDGAENDAVRDALEKEPDQRDGKLR